MHSKKNSLTENFTGKRQHGQVTSALNGDGHQALVPGAGTRLAARADLAIFGDEAAELICLFVIDDRIVVSAELADARRSVKAFSTRSGAFAIIPFAFITRILVAHN
jgi:hypothetical protein